jgi:hypothetical protein
MTGSKSIPSGRRASTALARKSLQWQAENDLVDSHARSYMLVSQYQSRLRMLAPPAVNGSVLALECSRAVAKLIKGKERIYDVHSTRAAQRDSKHYIPVRDMLRSLDGLVQRVLDQASSAFSRLPELRFQYNGWFKISDRWYGLANFDEMLDHMEQFSPLYLQWIAQVRLASPKTQLALRAYLDGEFHLKSISENPSVVQASINDGTEEPKEIGDARKQFEHIAKAISPSVRHLVDVRSELFVVTRFAFEETRVGRSSDVKPYAAWPFPLRLTGAEDGETLAAAVASYEVLGQWMQGCGASLVFVEFEKEGGSTHAGAVGCGAGQKEAQALWREVHEAGEAMVYLGAALHALVRVESSPHCQLCHRHVGQGYRKYCDLHARPDDGPSMADTHSNATLPIGSVHVRTQHRQSTLLAVRFKKHFELLEAAFARKLIWLEPTATIERALGRSRRQLNRNPHALGRTREQRADDVRSVVDVLRPVLGEILWQNMDSLLTKIKTWVSASPAAVKTLQGLDDDPELTRRMESLTLGGFFAHWFSGFNQTVAQSSLIHNGTDLTHPITAWKLIPTGRVNSPLRRISPLNLDAVVRDLLLHRAWLDVGGEQADAALLSGGAPLPGLRPKGRVDLLAARQMREVDQMSYAAIGEKFGVSRAAVYLALKREATKVPRSPERSVVTINGGLV